MENTYDVVVVGAGNAALCAALAAHEEGARILVLERAPEEESGGNSAFTAGAMRVVYHGIDDILDLVPDLSDRELETTDFGAYTEGDFYDDMERVTDARADPELVELLVTRSFDTLRWMRGLGVSFLPIYGRQAYNVDGHFKFWGGLTLEVRGGGPGLVQTLTKCARRSGIEIRYRTRAIELLMHEGAVHGVRVKSPSGTEDIRAGAVVLAAGGFQANAAWRAKYLGKNWDLAKVRGTRFNTGEGISMALDAGAMPWGHWSGCHAVSWDLNAPPFGDIKVGDGFQKHSYPLGIMVNARGERFLDEGLDFRNYTYAKYGSRVLEQPGQFAWQVFDAKGSNMLRDEYRIREVTRMVAGSLDELAGKLDGVDPGGFLRTVREFNASIDRSVAFDPNIRDGRCTVGLDVPKSNWANPIDEPPFEAYAVTCGVTFTFGGVRIDTQARVLDSEATPIPGLFACGEMVGGIFYSNYPGGSGLTSGAVFGRLAGSSAAKSRPDVPASRQDTMRI